MILSDDIRTQLMDLGPDVLFLGTRYLSLMMLENAVWPIGAEAPRLYGDPEHAAAIAAEPAPWDTGRGGIIAFDSTTLREPGQLIDTNEPGAFECRVLVIPNHVLAIYWLDDLAPGVGLAEPSTEGPARFRVVGYDEWRGMYEHMLECEARGVSEEAIRPAREAATGFGALEVHGIKEIYLVTEPGEPKTWQEDARRLLHSDEV